MSAVASIAEEVVQPAVVLNMVDSVASSVTPSYLEFLLKSYHFFAGTFQQLHSGKYGRQQLAQDLSLLGRQVSLIDLLAVTVLSVLFTAARHYSTKYIFKPITIWRGIGEPEGSKIPESAWKLSFYLTTWSLAAYLVHDAGYFYYPERVWHNYSPLGSMERGIYALYMIELGFYIHSLYTTLLVDQRRKDTNTLMLHHIVCILLLVISYCNRSHKSGLLTLFLHDGSDVLLEATKMVRYFKVQHGRSYDKMEIIVNIGFASFLLTWISNRLYWFPLKQVYVASVYVEEQSIQVPFITLLVGMLWIILLMNFYWFSFALKLLYKVASGQLNELEDNREFKEAGATAAADSKSENSASSEDARKLSVDSGVISVTGEETASDDGNESDKNSSSGSGPEEAITREGEDQRAQQLQQTAAAPNSPSNVSYNLRERRGVNFAMYR